MSDATAGENSERSPRARAPIAPRVLNPMDAARYIGVGRTKMFELLKEGKIPAKKSGSQTLIEVAALDAWIDGLPSVRGM
jgi:excisionase family DNA binding protein